MENLKRFALELLERANKRDADARRLGYVRRNVMDFEGHTQAIVAEVLREVSEAAMNAAFAACPHERLNEDGICRSCGRDCRRG